MSAEGLNIASTPKQPIALSNGFHASDLITPWAKVDPTLATVQKAALVSMRQWLAEWKPSTTGDSTRAPIPHIAGPIPQATPHTVPTKPLNAWSKSFGTV